jgi:hypothetical protein
MSPSSSGRPTRPSLSLVFEVDLHRQYVARRLRGGRNRCLRLGQSFDWVNPDQVHAFITELLQPIETYLYGRRLYETMAYWDGPVERYPPEHRDFARIWQKAQKIVFFTNADRRYDTQHALSSGTSTSRLFGSSSPNRSTTPASAAPNLRGLRSKPISSTNVSCFSTRRSSAAESRHSGPPYDAISNSLRRAISAPEVIHLRYLSHTRRYSLIRHKA